MQTIALGKNPEKWWRNPYVTAQKQHYSGGGKTRLVQWIAL
jgi:hypothetical protein